MYSSRVSCAWGLLVFLPGILSAQPSRIVADDAHSGVVRIQMRTRDGRDTYCSGYLAGDRVVTAKHCFREGETAIGVEFYENGQRIAKIPVDPRNDFRRDPYENDHAYLKIPADQIPPQVVPDYDEVYPRDPTYQELGNSGMRIEMVGYLQYRDGSGLHERTRIASTDCRIENRRAGIPAKPPDQPYDGLCQSVSCPGWFGISGGIVVGTLNGQRYLLGTVTHTLDFEPTNGNRLQPGTGGQDTFGPYARSTCFSPAFSSAWMRRRRSVRVGVRVTAIPGSVGVRVQSVQPGLAFARAGFAPGDVIESVNGKPVTGLDAFDWSFDEGRFDPGAHRIAFTVARGGDPAKVETITVPLPDAFEDIFSEGAPLAGMAPQAHHSGG
jgi:hypothetical protein